jgi:hypothetical protein
VEGNAALFLKEGKDEGGVLEVLTDDQDISDAGTNILSE